MDKYDIFIGIDPGETGAIAAIYKNGTNIIPMPLTPSGEDIDTLEAYQFITGFMTSGRVFVAIERAQSMPGQGVTSMFKYGRGYGKLLAALELSRVSFEEIHPAKWKKAVGLVLPKIKPETYAARKKRLKLASSDLALKLFPDTRGQVIGPRGGIKDGIAEALLIAEYGRRIYK